MLERGTENTPPTQPAPPGTVVAGRFARDPGHFAATRRHGGVGDDRPDARRSAPNCKALLRRVKLGRCLDTLPERLALAQTGGLGHAEFLELVLADEVTRRETTSADAAGHAPPGSTRP